VEGQGAGDHKAHRGRPGRPQDSCCERLSRHPIYISTLTEIELFSHASMTEEEETRLEAFLEAVQILPLTSQIARIAGDLRRLHPSLKAFDSGIAATALFTHSTLITRNIRDFQDIDGLSLMAI
jgi:toxin FitB